MDGNAAERPTYATLLIRDISGSKLDTSQADNPENRSAVKSCRPLADGEGEGGPDGRHTEAGPMGGAPDHRGGRAEGRGGAGDGGTAPRAGSVHVGPRGDVDAARGGGGDDGAVVRVQPGAAVRPGPRTSAEAVAREGVARRLSRAADTSAALRWADGRDIAAGRLLTDGDAFEAMANAKAGTADRATATDLRARATECRHAAAVLLVHGWGAAFALWPYVPAGGQ